MADADEPPGRSGRRRSRTGSSLTLQQAGCRSSTSTKLDLVLNGHDHEYEISKPLVGGVPQASNKDATVYWVGGGAGAELYDIGVGTIIGLRAYAEKTYSAAMVRVTRNTLGSMRSGAAGRQPDLGAGGAASARRSDGRGAGAC